MNPEEYLEKMAALGVNRRALAGRFPEDRPCGNHATGHEQPNNWRVSKWITAEKLGIQLDDLTHLNPRRSGKGGRPARNK